MGMSSVLIIDDDAGFRVQVKALLVADGFAVAGEAEDGWSGLEAARFLRPDYVLLDLGLPGMDGFEVARRLRSRPGGDALFIAAVTAYRGEEHQRQAREAGFDRYLMKPVDIDTLRQVLTQAANGGPMHEDFDSEPS